MVDGCRCLGNFRVVDVDRGPIGVDGRPRRELEGGPLGGETLDFPNNVRGVYVILRSRGREGEHAEGGDQPVVGPCAVASVENMSGIERLLTVQTNMIHPPSMGP